ncbi:DUF1796 family putative cysteine peptidase [Clostridium rectalis]|uniref:DUF1796 family putative cysteine peptidase n=1 Tax=Clostridium rectalis TaxID=2040295 RepID=UPI000F6438C4|nr:DUF1796 family putative cysteine peptidase [Clostridium rectalis]
MKLEEIKKPYETVISLGSYYEVAHQLDRYNLRKFTGPIDWLVLENIYNLNRTLKNGFSDLMRINNLKIEAKKNGYYTVRDIYYNCLSVHDFPINDYDKDWYSMYDQFSKRFKTRIDNFFYHIQNSSSILFIRLGVEYKGIKELTSILNKYVEGEYNILALNYLNDKIILPHNKKVREKDWNLKNVCYAEVPNTKGKWEGDNEAWNYLLEGISLDR